MLLNMCDCGIFHIAAVHVWLHGNPVPREKDIAQHRLQRNGRFAANHTNWSATHHSKTTTPVQDPFRPGYPSSVLSIATPDDVLLADLKETVPDASATATCAISNRPVCYADLTVSDVDAETIIPWCQEILREVYYTAQVS
jgi:hypothetical protein